MEQQGVSSEEKDIPLTLKIIPYANRTNDQLDSCSKLFSNSYGVWQGNKSLSMWGKPGKPIALKPDSIKSGYFYSDQCTLITASIGEKLVGQLFFSEFYVSLDAFNKAKIRWVTQLVVDKDHRHRGIAKKMLTHLLESTVDGYGVASSNAFTVEALEKATGRKCMILQPDKAKLLLDSSGVPYLQKATDITCEPSKSFINTNFPISHEEVDKNLANAKKNGWQLGDALPPEREFLAFVPMSSKTLSWCLKTNKEDKDTLVTSMGISLSMT